jgi:hypothetical protein
VTDWEYAEAVAYTIRRRLYSKAGKKLSDDTELTAVYDPATWQIGSTRWAHERSDSSSTPGTTCGTHAARRWCGTKNESWRLRRQRGQELRQELS